MIAWARCSVCGRHVGYSRGYRVSEHNGGDNALCPGTGEDARPALRAQVRDDLRRFEAEAKQLERYIASARKTLAKIEKDGET